MSIKAIIFDMGGVVTIDIMPFINKEVERVLRMKPDKFLPVMDKYVDDLQKDYTDELSYWRRVCKELNIIVPDKKLIHLYSSPQEKHAKLKPEMVALIKHLKTKYKVGLITNTINNHYNFTIQQGWYDMFDVAIISNIVKLRKPEPEIYELALKKLFVKPKEVVFIDDIKEFLVPAKKMGIHTIHFTSYDALIQELKKLKIDCTIS
jgi:epoxide hydrolase-like predicted phosphatase